MSPASNFGASPLLEHDHGDHPRSKASESHPWMVYLSICIVVSGSYEFGAWIGYSSPTQSAITQDLSLTTAEIVDAMHSFGSLISISQAGAQLPHLLRGKAAYNQPLYPAWQKPCEGTGVNLMLMCSFCICCVSLYALFGSILPIGAMVGAITSGAISDGIGRKSAMRVFSLVCATGWLAIYFAQGALALDIGRLAGGYGMGAFSYVIPVYIAEIAPVNLRGALATTHQLLICTGLSVSFVIGLVLSWRVLALIGLIPCAILFIGLYFIPESPRWLAKRGYAKEFHAALQKLRGEDADITREAAEIQECIQQLVHHPKSSFFDLLQRRYLLSLMIGVGLMISQQLGGIGGVTFYISDTLETAGASSTVGTIAYAFIEVSVTAIGATLMDKAGGKPLILISATGLALGSVLASVGFYLKGHDQLGRVAPFITLAGLVVYIAAFSTGMGAVPWLIMSEIFPIHVKGQAGSLATLVNWLCSWVVSYTFSFLMSWNSYGTFLLYAAVNALAALFIIKMVPETKGRSLEEIQAAING